MRNRPPILRMCKALTLLYVATACSLVQTACGGAHKLRNRSGAGGTGHLTITSAPPLSGTVGVNYRGFTPTASGGTPPYDWTWAASPGSTLPPGLNLSNSGIYGAPTAAGTYNVVITAKDSAFPANQGSASFKIDISNSASIVIITFPPPPAAGINLPYSFRFTTLGGQKPLTWSEAGALPPGLSLSNPDIFGGVLSGTPTITGSFPITVMVTDAGGQNATSQDFTIRVGLHGFKVTGKFAASRRFHDATLLQDGRVLVTGGTDPSGSSLSSAELYDPATRTFSGTGNMLGARGCHVGTLLNDGRVLIAGGFDTGGNGPMATAELFDPAFGTFSATGNMAAARACPTGTLLKDGKVLIVGGFDSSGPLISTELFDPTSGTFSSGGPMKTARVFHTATLLADGRVLVAGGVDSAATDFIDPIFSAELFDPATGGFSATGGMTATRFSHTATLLSNGKVLISGGSTKGNFAGEASLASAEIFDAATGKFASTGSMAIARADHTATLLNDGTVLVSGGDPDNIMNLVTGTSIGSLPVPLSCAEIFDPISGTFMETGGLVTAREVHTATRLKDGTVLVTGGFGNGLTAETYQ